ncbi:ArsR family transcriptional regulator [Patescibacteria group bacterium]|nr:MAG: ArsR family transcriptional regulator [Patescibacteria group bacterium]
MSLRRLFGSRTRSKLLNLFLKNAGRSFYVRELTRKIDEEINSVRRELENLEGLGLISASKKKNRKYYTVDKSFYLYPELEKLINKVEEPAENKIVNHIKQLKTLRFVLLTGRFIEDPKSPIDVLMVGQISDKHKLKGILKRFEQELGQEVNYALMDVAEFSTRRSVKDRFLMSALSDDAVILYDTLKFKKSQPPSAEGKPKKKDLGKPKISSSKSKKEPKSDSQPHVYIEKQI